jgi:tight adherence protein B
MFTVVVLMIAAFLAVAVSVLALGMTARDLVAAARGTPKDEDLILLPTQPAPQGSLGIAFRALLDEAGAGIDDNAALAVVVGSATVGGALTIFLTENLLATAAAILVGVCIPLAVWMFMGWRRCSIMRAALSESLQMVADSVRAGHSLEQAAELVAHELKGPLGVEFQYCASHLKLGQSPIAVLERMVQRVPLPEFRVFATAVLVHRRTGGNLANLTDRLATAARDRQEFAGHLGAVTAGSRLSAVGLVIGALVGVAVLSWIEPDYIKHFLTAQSGPALLLIAALLQMAGAFWVWRILKVSY